MPDRARPVRALDPAALCQALDGVLPAERTLVVDGGHFTGYPCAWLQVPDPTGFVFTLGFGSVGLGLAAATGAAVGPSGPHAASAWSATAAC